MGDGGFTVPLEIHASLELRLEVWATVVGSCIVLKTKGWRREPREKTPRKDLQQHQHVEHWQETLENTATVEPRKKDLKEGVITVYISSSFI